MNSLSVAHVSNVIGGGMGTVYRALLPAQVQKGDTVSFFVRQADQETLTYFAAAGVEMRVISGPLSLARDLRAFDVVHMHGADLDLLLAGWMSRRATVFTLHGLRAQTRAITTVSLKSLPTVRGLRRRLKRLALSLLMAHAVCEVTAVSRFLAHKAATLYHVDPDEVTVVYSGIATGHPRGQALTRGSGGAVVGWLGRLVPVKRVDMLLRAVAAIASGRSFPGLGLVIVGDGPLKQELTALADSLGIGRIVRFTGHVQDPERYLASMDVFAFPSENEGAGSAANEAMAAGLPVVVLEDGGGAVELVQRSGAGVVVPDEAALAREIAALLYNVERRRALGAAGVAYVERELDPGEWVTRYEQVYLKAIGERGRRGAGRRASELQEPLE